MTSAVKTRDANELHKQAIAAASAEIVAQMASQMQCMSPADRTDVHEEAPSHSDIHRPQAAVSWNGNGIVSEANGATSSGESPGPLGAVGCNDTTKLTADTMQEICEKILLRHIPSPFSSKGQRLKGSSTSIINKRSSGPIPAAGRGTGITCLDCHKVIPRSCDMKKHQWRHTRPFGCTFPNCNKMFGSKNDWKRHENSQHFQLESWRCHQLNPMERECAQLFYRREKFQQHLRQDHGIEVDETIREEVALRRIGRNGQNQFWCGFCRRICPLKNRNLEAWDERFTHIANHFKTKKIEEWVPVDADRPKGQLLSLNAGADALVDAIDGGDEALGWRAARP
ncbi:MAG: hypothetical protein M1829_006947 [Trizodia sp. TS-e1964]|nr:MAG: hypothetical protein M1829_006947 [Trizodia sp. TS-e1964]